LGVGRWLSSENDRRKAPFHHLLSRFSAVSFVAGEGESGRYEHIYASIPLLHDLPSRSRPVTSFRPSSHSPSNSHPLRHLLDFLRHSPDPPPTAHTPAHSTPPPVGPPIVSFLQRLDLIFPRPYLRFLNGYYTLSICSVLRADVDIGGEPTRPLTGDGMKPRSRSSAAGRGRAE
jgi:hypothetical protein